MTLLTPGRKDRLRTIVRWARGRVLTPLRVLPEIAQSRRYAESLCDLRGGDAGGQSLRLGVVGGFPVLEYVRLGYDWLAPYYNPLLLFEEVHYFQNYPAPPLRWVDWGYRFYIHQFATPQDIIAVCRSHRIDILRAYDPEMGRVATAAAAALRLPVVVSVH